MSLGMRAGRIGPGGAWKAKAVVAAHLFLLGALVLELLVKLHHVFHRPSYCSLYRTVPVIATAELVGVEIPKPLLAVAGLTSSDPGAATQRKVAR